MLSLETRSGLFVTPSWPPAGHWSASSSSTTPDRLLPHTIAAAAHPTFSFSAYRPSPKQSLNPLLFHSRWSSAHTLKCARATKATRTARRRTATPVFSRLGVSTTETSCLPSDVGDPRVTILLARWLIFSCGLLPRSLDFAVGFGSSATKPFWELLFGVVRWRRSKDGDASCCFLSLNLWHHRNCFHPKY